MHSIGSRNPNCDCASFRCARRIQVSSWTNQVRIHPRVVTLCIEWNRSQQLDSINGCDRCIQILIIRPKHHQDGTSSGWKCRRTWRHRKCRTARQQSFSSQLKRWNGVMLLILSDWIRTKLEHGSTTLDQAQLHLGVDCPFTKYVLSKYSSPELQPLHYCVPTRSNQSFCHLHPIGLYSTCSCVADIGTAFGFSRIVFAFYKSRWIATASCRW